jgi:iron complex transport system substrate-binding protein
MRGLIAALVWLFAHAAVADIVVRDDRGRELRLATPAERIVSLSPHGTELLFAAGAGERVVGAVEYSDYPAAASALPRVGSYTAFDVERILALKPDLVVGWYSGNGPGALERLRKLGLTVYVTESRRFQDVLRNIEELGALAGTDANARATTAALRNRLTRLRSSYAGKSTVSVFYQVWHRPLMTVGGPHLVTHMIEICGGQNVFSNVDALAPSIDVEAVLAADPEAIVASGMAEERPEWLDDWRRWPQLQAVRAENLFFIPPDLLQRPTPRLLDGAERLCHALDSVRRKRGQ